MQDFELVYKLLDIHYDIQCGESFYNDRLPGVVERLLKSGIAEISQGAVVVFRSEEHTSELQSHSDLVCRLLLEKKKKKKIKKTKNKIKKHKKKINII